MIAYQKKADAFEATDSTEEEVAHIRLLTAMTEAEHGLYRKKTDLVREHIQKAETNLSIMHWHSIETQFRLACVKTELALKNDREYQKDLDNLISLFDRFPSFEFRHCLQELKSRYELSTVNLPEDKPMFLDLCYTHLLPFIMPGIRVKVCGGVAIPQFEEGGDGMTQTVKK